MALSPDRARLNRWCEEHVQAMVDLTAAMARMESPSDDEAALRRFADWFTPKLEELGAKVERAAGGHLVCRFPGSEPGVLALGHYDTVWPIGTLERMPVHQADGRLWGPGVMDMKGGVALFLYALKGLAGGGFAPQRAITLLINSDEETGSRTSRALTEGIARNSRAVLVLEPGTGLEGKLKTARKGIGDYRVTVTGRAAHSGVDFAAGASAVLELARQLLKIVEFTDVERGITVNPGVISGGTRANVIAERAEALIDLRVSRAADAGELDARFRSLKPIDSRCRIEVDGGLNRPPMERTEGVAWLFEMAKRLGAELGLNVRESATGGGSDGNFTAALGVPTLDGLGVAGEGAHAANESFLIAPLAGRMALLSALLAELTG